MISNAKIIGRSHRLQQQNCQDAAFCGTASTHYHYGLVLDGCGSKYPEPERQTPSHNEVGANLLGTFLANTLHDHLLTLGNRPAIDSEQIIMLLDGIYQQCLLFLRQVVSLLPFNDDAAVTRFIMTRLLCTIVGFVNTPTTAVAFWQGDGYIRHNNTVITLDSDDRPDYLAYHLLGLNESMYFHTQTIATDQLSHLAVATDGWSPDLLCKLDAPHNDLLLQRWLNQQAQQKNNFDDDGAIAILWRD